MHPWQKDLVTTMAKGEVKIMMTGRRVGKSMFSAQALKRLMDDLYKDRPVEDLILTEGKVHGARYFCVQPEGGSWTDMEAWARQTYGDPGEIWPLKDTDDYGWPESNRWYMNNRKFWFREERDRDWFIIKWNS